MTGDWSQYGGQEPLSIVLTCESVDEILFMYPSKCCITRIGMAGMTGMIVILSRSRK